MLKVSPIVMLLFMKPSSISPSQTQSVSVIQREGQMEERGGYNRGYTLYTNKYIPSLLMFLNEYVVYAA